MADSKITQLPLSPYVLDKDLMVVVTGHLEEGAYPQNAKIPLSYIRRYVVRLNLMSNAVSGIDTYYNSGLNILTSWTTGIHAIPGNNIEVQFSSDTPASNLYAGTGPICHSGIISTTGLNAYGQNLIKIDYDSTWPHSGIISITGLNAVTGGYFSNGILTLTRLELSDIQIEIPGSEADGNNYPTGLFFDNSTRNLTIGLSGLSDLSVNIPDSDANNYITDMLFDNNSRNLTLERLGLEDLIVNIPDTSSASNTRNYRIISSNTTLTTGDEVVIVDASSNSVGITLPPAANMAGRTISVKISDISDPYSCNIQTQNSETIDGNLSYTIHHKNTSISLFSNSNNWFIL